MSNSKIAHYQTVNLALKVPHLRSALAVSQDINLTPVNHVWQSLVEHAQDVRITLTDYFINWKFNYVVYFYNPDLIVAG